MIAHSTQTLIVDAFRALLATEGEERFLHVPFVEPEGAFFPDAWAPDQAGVHRLLRRIMGYAGLGEVPLAVERFVFDADEDQAAPERGRHVIAFFRGVKDGACQFGVSCAQLDDPEYLIGVLAHEVAHAYRAIHDLVVDDDEQEEELTDLTTIFLGLGIFTANNAHQSTISGYEQRVRRAGYLSPHVMAFALASWVKARGAESDRAVVERWLEPMQASMFARVLAELPEQRIRDRLALGEVTPAIGQRPSALLDDAPPAAGDAEPIDFTAKRSATFRTLVRPQRFTTVVGAFVGGLVPLINGTAGAAVIVIGAIVGAACGYVLGRFLARDECALRDCESTIPVQAARCPRCGAIVQGVLADRANIHEALDDLRRKRLVERRARLERDR